MYRKDIFRNLKNVVYDVLYQGLERNGKVSYFVNYK